jgi:hypothetical protein
MRTRIAVIALCAVLLGSPVLADEVKGSVQIGGHTVGTMDNINRAAEYRTANSGGDLVLDLNAALGDFFVALQSNAFDTQDQKHLFDLEVGRLLRSHTTFTRLPHRLEHDALANLQGVVGEVKVTGSTDMDPGGVYKIKVDTLTNRTDFQIPGAGWLLLTADYREQWREGHKQSLSLSHCSTCHVQSQAREVDEHIQEVGVGGRLTFGSWSLSGRAATRDFRERGTTPERYYELAEHPAQRKPLFNDRIQYSNAVLPYDQVPNTEKDSTTVKLANADLAGFSVAVSAYASDVTNLQTNNSVDYESLSFLAARSFGKNVRLSLTARQYEIDSTDYFVDTVEPVAVAGVYPGKTYREQYGLDPDFLRTSAVDRDVTEVQARLGLRLGKGGTLTAAVEGRSIDRVNYEVAPGETETSEQKVRLSWSMRPAKGFNLRLEGTYADIDNPFMSLDAACLEGPLQTASKPSPMAPGSVQYYQIHDARIGDLGASPSEYTELKALANLRLGASALASFSYRWWDGENNDLDLTDWSKTLDALTASITFTPSEKTDAFVGATWVKRELETHICIPLMDG